MSEAYEIEWSEYREQLSNAARVHASRYEALARRLSQPDDRLALDVGCGAAGMAIALAAALPDGARVLALDGSEELLDEARKNLEAAGISPDRARVAQCDLEHGLDGLRAVVDEPADLIWASAVIHHVADQQAAVDHLVELLAPGGRLALGEGGLRPRYLPWDLGVGEPGLESRVDAILEVWFGGMRAALPGGVRMPYGWNEALRRAGLVDVRTESDLLERSAPLSTEDTTFVVGSVRKAVQHAREAGLLTTDDEAAWDRLLDRSDPAWIGARNDLFLLDVRSVHVGVKPVSWLERRA